MDRERVNPGGELVCERSVDQAVALDSALPPERLRHNIDPEMRFSSRPVSSVPLMPVGFVQHPQAFGGESLAQFSCDLILYRHGGALGRRGRAGQPA